MSIETPETHYRSAFRRFHNGLRILMNIDSHAFPGPSEEWPAFRDNPWRYFITCDDTIAHALWTIIERRNNPPQEHAP